MRNPVLYISENGILYISENTKSVFMTYFIGFQHTTVNRRLFINMNIQYGEQQNHYIGKKHRWESFWKRNADTTDLFSRLRRDLTGHFVNCIKQMYNSIYIRKMDDSCFQNVQNIYIRIYIYQQTTVASRVLIRWGCSGYQNEAEELCFPDMSIPRPLPQMLLAYWVIFEKIFFKNRDFFSTSRRKIT